MQIRVDSVIIRERARKDPGDLQSLMDSMTKHGQLNPIIVNSKMQLIAGYRRLAAAKALGWQKINATVLEISDKSDMLEIEIDENVHRLSFVDKDLKDAYCKLEKLRKPNFFQSSRKKISSFFKKIFKGKNKE